MPATTTAPSSHPHAWATLNIRAPRRMRSTSLNILNIRQGRPTPSASLNFLNIRAAATYSATLKSLNIRPLDAPRPAPLRTLK